MAPLADAFAGERDDRRLMDMVLTLYRFMQSHPFPEKWLAEKVAMYFPGPDVYKRQSQSRSSIETTFLKVHV